MIELKPVDVIDKCSVCKAKPTPERFCDLTLVDTGTQAFILCHDCAHKLIEELLGRYYALWGQALMFSDAVTAERAACLKLSFPSLPSVCSRHYNDGYWDGIEAYRAAIRSRGD